MNSPYSFIGMIALMMAVAISMFNVDRIDRAQKIDEARIIEAADNFLALEQRLYQQGIDSARWPAQNLGAAGTEVPTVVALFSTSLAAQISSSATSMTLVSAADKAGVTLASSTYPFIIDEGTASEEMVIADCTGTACANMIRGIDPVTGTSSVSSLKKSHRRGASVKITDGPQLMVLSRMANGIGQYPNLLQYKNTVLISAASASTTLATKYYVDNVALSGAPDASETVKGVVELGTALEVASSSSSGGTSAFLVMQSKNATDTPQSGCASGYGSTAGAGCSIIASLTGKIKQAWLDLTAAFTWTGNQTWNGSTNVFTGTTPLIGIGTSTPYAALSVVGQIVGTYFTATSTTATSTFDGNLRVANNATTTNLTISGTCSGCTGITSSSTAKALATGSGNTTSQSASCTAPKVATGGGFSGLPANATNGTAEYVVTDNYFSNSTTWTASVHCNQSGTCPSGTITVYVICANP